MPRPGRPVSEKPDIFEKGGMKDGEPQRLDRRLLMQLLVYEGCGDDGELVEALKGRDFEAVLYKDMHRPDGVGLLTMSESADFFVDDLRDFLRDSAFSKLDLRPEMTMFGRTYSLGYEPDLEDTLLGRPRRTTSNEDWPWAVWYPLRRSGEFAVLDAKEQREILMEHGTIGIAFGDADYAHDVRLSCHGLDTFDNDFVVGLVGKELHPLSAVVQRMRSTKQTSQYLTNLGPFFVGKAIYQSQSGK